MVDDMRSENRHRRRGFALSTGLLIALTVFGVLLMHSVTPISSTSTSMSMGAHSAMVPMPAVDSSIPVAFGEHDCPSAHQMTHPCVWTTASWPALTVPPTIVGFELAAPTEAGIGGRTESTLGRGPPWTKWQLDRSVTLRV
jgi:hypothetical protein